MLRVLHYDRDPKGYRQSKNCLLMSESLPSGFEVIFRNVCHLKSFSGVVGLEDMLLESPLPFDVAVVNGCSADVYRVLESVKVGLELNSLSLSRVVYLCPDGSVSDNCIKIVPVGSNGYFVNAKNARQVVDKLIELSRVNFPESGPGFVMY